MSKVYYIPSFGALDKYEFTNLVEALEQNENTKHFEGTKRLRTELNKQLNK